MRKALCVGIDSYQNINDLHIVSKHLFEKETMTQDRKSVV